MSERNWYKLFQSFSESNLSITEFCKSQNVAPSTFYKKKRLLKLDFKLKPLLNKVECKPTTPKGRGFSSP